MQIVIHSSGILTSFSSVFPGLSFSDITGLTLGG